MDLPPITPAAHAPGARPDPLMTKAKEMEAAFLAEMLAHTGLGASEGPFSGGPGEDQFASFLRQEQARLVVESGGIGLAELIFNTMVEERGHDTP